MSAASSGKYVAKLTKQRFLLELQDQLTKKLRKREPEDGLLEHSERLRARDTWKRGLSGRANGTIDPWYQCDLYTEMIEYALNFTFPWCTYTFISIPFGCSLENAFGVAAGQDFDYYDVPDALSPEASTDGSVFLNGACLSLDGAGVYAGSLRCSNTCCDPCAYQQKLGGGNPRPVWAAQ